MIDVQAGEYVLIRVDGSETTIAEKPTIQKLQRDLGCDCLDMLTMTLNCGRGGPIVMAVDDTGMIRGLPVNPRATALVREVRPGYGWGIHGDVALVRDSDFGHL